MDVHRLIRDIVSKRGRAEDLPALRAYAEGILRRRGFIMLAFSVISVLDGVPEDEEPALLPETKAFVPALRGFYARYMEGEEGLFGVFSDFRKELIRCAESFQTLSELYKTQEYALNRVEYRFREGSLPDGYSDASFSQRLLSVLANVPQDRQGVFIAETVPELPVRITKNRFLEQVGERLTVYKASDRNAYEEALSSLSDALGLPAAGFTGSLSRYAALYDEMKNLRYAELTAEDHGRLRGLLDEESGVISANTDYLQLIQRAANELLSLILLGKGEDEESRLEKELIRDTFSAFDLKGEEREACLRDVLSRCGGLENDEEDLRDRTDELRTVYSHLENENSPDPFVSDLCSRWETVLRLTGGSLYAPLSEPEAVPLTEADFKELTEAFLEKADLALSGTDRLFRRALMSRVFSILPPRFRSAEEYENYALSALTACTDAAEKTGAVEVLTKLMGAFS